MIIIQCPCCGYYTISVDETQDIIIDFCEVCGWQYDWVAQKYPDLRMSEIAGIVDNFKKQINNHET